MNALPGADCWDAKVIRRSANARRRGVVTIAVLFPSMCAGCEGEVIVVECVIVTVFEKTSVHHQCNAAPESGDDWFGMPSANKLLE